VPWLEPDILDHLRALRELGVDDVVVSPLGFVSDHIEVLYDLDIEASAVAADLGLTFVRASTASTHPAFVSMIRELVQERLDTGRERRALGRFGPSHDICPIDCCLPGTGRPSPWELPVSREATATRLPPLPAP
jgi:ferrochelatase